MKKISLVSLLVLIIWFFWSLLSSCGTWSVFGTNQEKPNCKCIGKIVKSGGPSGPADDRGGNFSCIGLKIPKF